MYTCRESITHNIELSRMYDPELEFSFKFRLIETGKCAPSMIRFKVSRTDVAKINILV